MPNWIYNEIKTDNPEIIPTFMDEGGNFDFNKLIPMPESLNIESGSNTDRAICFYVTQRLTIPVEQTNLRNMISNMFNKDWAREVASRVSVWAETASVEEQDKLYAMGQQYVYNYEHYNHCFTWYEWRTSPWGWGCKWNAADTNFNSDSPCEVSFSTPWSCPEPVMEKLCELFPDAEITFHCEYEDGVVVEYENVDGELVQTNEYELSYDDEDEEDEEYEYEEDTEAPDYDDSDAE